ncbi:helix-turn-helix transcriptional regulator [Amycolatopsis sp., V23-08]|uniref:Helix-turn-helix transcriptional regulator n=1 Tax=Amycolatopsis heterodermiae TaxID=3110235 RepID=A0ABU5RLS9_9PSEU|nr:helix-turn-helix transcriptional regulator [Amycolatopsis sp., V23-08]MEA5367252.1 helix-turn-helix transcriptional regulator [Amycolatopsis sp., V23-08]
MVSVEVSTKVFPARPSAVPEIREFLRGCLADSPLPESEDRELGNTILSTLLAAAGPAGMIEISCRKYPGRVEFDVLPSATAHLDPATPEPDPEEPDPAESFAEWMTEALRRTGTTREAAAQRLGVSVKTVNRWIGGQTEPRLRELRRIQDQFGDVPLR